MPQVNSSAKYTKIGDKYYTEQTVRGRWSDVVPGKSGGYGTMLTEIDPKEIQNRFGQGQSFQQGWQQMLSDGSAQELDPSQVQEFFSALANQNTYVPTTIPQNTETVAGNPLAPGRNTPSNMSGYDASGNLVPIGGPTPPTYGDVTGPTTSTPAYRDAQGNVYDAQGNHLTLDQIPKGANGLPSVNLTTLPLKATTGGGSANSGGNSGSGAGGASQGQQIYRDNANNFFSVSPDGTKTPISQAQFQQLGLNEKFVPAGQTVSIQQAQTGQQVSTVSGGTGGSGGGIAYDPSWEKYGITQDVWSSLNTTQQGVVGASLSAAKSLYGANASNVTLQQALAAAAKDPNLIAKYADMASIDSSNFTNSLNQLQIATSTQAQNYQTQFNNERKALAEAQASSGTAYSGFRGAAQNQLATSESGIVTSSRADAQAKLDQMTREFQAKYGTAATNPAVLAFANPFDSATSSISGQRQGGTQTPESLTGSMVSGNITGTAPVAKQQEINSLASNYVTLGQTPPVTAA